MIRRFRNRKLSKDNQKDLAIMLKAICIDDGDVEVGESIIRNMEGGKMDEVAIEVASFMAHKTAERFADMVNGRRFSDIMQMVGGIQEADPAEAVRMLQMSFFSHGMTAEAEDLEILDICAGIDSDIHEYFIDSFMQEEDIDWFAVECWVDEHNVELAERFS
ncbi:MAG: hypothetical protein E7227_04440 [Clostridiales bacterium]|nr:hypothetical protein [Clostridiales bacterium]